MTPSQLAKYLASIVEHDLRLSLMIWGAPGIGKSSIVAQAAADAGLDFIDVRLSQLAPTDLRGLPVPERSTDGSSSGIARWYPPEFLPRTGRGILFLDELNMAAPSMQGVAQQLILDRRVGSYVLPKGWFVWAAGNRKEDRASVFDMPAPLANRFAHLEVVADLVSFKEHAIARGVSEQVLSFLAFRPDLLHRMDPSRPAWPSPRSWFMADALMKADLEIDPVIGAPAAAEFRAYLAVYESVPDLEAILQGRGAGIACPDEVSVRYATAIGLALRARTAEGAVAAFHWVHSRLSTEWCRTFMQDVVRSMTSKGLQGPLSEAFMADPQFKAYAKDTREVMATP
jgi:MoxR-like ATPase